MAKTAKSSLDIFYENQGYELSDPVDLDEYMESLEEERKEREEAERQRQAQQQQQSGGTPNVSPQQIKQFMPGQTSAGTSTPAAAGGEAGAGGTTGLTPAGTVSGGGTGAGGGGLGAGPMAAIIAAAIALQHYGFSNNTEREFEGQKTDDAFGGHFLTEPYQAYAYQKMGIDSPSAGEKFDAAVKNKDWGLAARRSASAFAHDPVEETIYDASKSKWGKKTAAFIDPGRYLLDKIGG